jgi:hypothetical protein
MRRRVATGALGAVLGLALTGLGYADEAKKAESAKVEAKKDGPPALTNEALEARLKKLGYMPKKITGPTAVTYEVRFSRDGWDQIFQVGLVNNGRQMAMFSSLGELKPAGALPAAELEKLLRKNDDIGPTIFVVAKGRQLVLARMLSTQGLTAAKFRQRVDEFTTTIVQTAPLWRSVTKR